MNKRLLLALYDRSGLGAYMPVDYKGHELAVEEHMEKFAEAIVRECMTQIEEVKQIQVRQMPVLEYTQGFDDGMFVAIRTIEEHFGVEL